MPYSLLYRRPSYVSSRASTISTTSTSAWSVLKPSSSEAGKSYSPHGVPDDLSFDRIISGKTCKPCTIRDFMNYLLYVEHSAESLQFFLWYRDYLMRFANLPASEKALSPIWLDEKFDADFNKSTSRVTASSRPSTNDKDIEVLPNFDMTLETQSNKDDGASVSRTDSVHEMLPSSPTKLNAMKAWDGTSSIQSSARGDFRQVAADAFESHNIVAPFTVQPYREEVTRIIATYIAEGSPRELNLAAREREGLLRALASTTHPSAFGRVAATVETSLRRQSHPNFVRFSICNGDKPRIAYATLMGWSNLAFGLIMGILLCLSQAPRGYRAFSSFFVILGISTLIMAKRGICIVLNTFHQCHLQPWELFEEEPDTESVYEMKMNSFDSIGSSNSFEDQPWVSKYKNLPFMKKVFSRQTRINEPALRKLHDTMLLQSLIGALAGTIVIEAIFLAVPHGNLY